MFKCVIRRTAFALTGSAVVVNSVDKTKDREENFWSNLLPSFLLKDESSSFDTASVKQKDELTGWDRLYIMYSKDEFGGLSKELNTILYVTYTSFFAGAMFGIVSRTKDAHHQFLEKNQATQFANVYEARRAMHDKVMIAGLKGMLRHGCRLAFFTGGILTCVMSMMVYSNQTSILHYGLAAGTMGALHKWKLGLRGMYAGGVVGGVLGLIAGGMTKGLFFIFGMDMDDLLTYNDSIMQNRDKKWRDMQKKSMESKIDITPLLKEHDNTVEVPKSDILNVQKQDEKILQQENNSAKVQT